MHMKLDADLKKDVMAELLWNAAIISKSLEVTVNDGIVLFAGRLASHADKRAIERATCTIDGVKGMVFETEVVLAEDHRRDDLDIAAAAEHALEWNALVPNSVVKPIVEQGWITLVGNVPWAFNRKAAERAVSDLIGVTGVTNRIEVTPQVMAEDVERTIRDALIRQARREGQRIEVAVDGSVVTLRGCVHSIAERRAAQSAAWAAPGVTSVVDALVVRPSVKPREATDGQESQ